MNNSLTQFKSIMTVHGAVYSDESAAHPSHFGSPESEESTAQQNVILFELSTNKLLEITGGDRIHFLHNFCTQDIKALQPGCWGEVFVPDIKSHALGYGLIFAEADSFWMEMAPNSTEALLPHFTKFSFLDDVEIHDRSDEWGLLFLSGPNSANIFDTENLPQLNEHQTLQVAGTECTVARIDRLGQPGYLLKMPQPQLADVWQKLVEAETQPAGNETYNSLRIAAGHPLYGVDISEIELVQEVDRSATAISFTKGCYLGQEPIARIDSLGHVNRKLCRLHLASKTGTLDLPTVYSAADNKEIGRITSTAFSCLKETQIALGYIKTKSLSADVEMYVLIDDTQVPVTML